VFDQSGMLYGQIVAVKSETRIAYILLARDIFRDIKDQFGGRHVRLPQETDFVSEVVENIKRDLSLTSSATRAFTSAYTREPDKLNTKPTWPFYTAKIVEARLEVKNASHVRHV
jgi:hypothetical protein